jgi:hypothetical protein
MNFRGISGGHYFQFRESLEITRNYSILPKGWNSPIEGFSMPLIMIIQDNHSEEDQLP